MALTRLVISTLLLANASSVSADDAQADQPASIASAEPEYLVILGEPDSFAQDFARIPSEGRRRLGFGSKLRLLDTNVEDLARQTTLALDTAERTGLPVLLSLDDWNFPEPSSDPEVVEWTNWPGPGEDHGPIAEGRWINWGFWFFTSPPPNFESPKFRANVRQRLQEAVLPVVAARVEKWAHEGREHLFAGLVVGWETGYYTFYQRVDPENPPTIDATGRSHSHQLREFTEKDAVGTGYAALTTRGYDRAKVQTLAEREGLSERAAVKQLMTGVINDYIGFIADLCRDAGIPRARLYSHIAGLGSFDDAFLESIDMHHDGRVLPIKTAVHASCRPGVTVTPEWCDLDAVAGTFRSAGQPAWGAVEIEITNAIRDEAAALAYLNRLTACGAKLICVYGWWEPEGSIFQVRGTGAVKAMRQWLTE